MSSGQVVRSRRGRETVLDMARSLGLLVVVIGVLLLITPARKLVFPDSGGGAAPAVSDSQQLVEWRQLTGHPALLPPLPAGWHVNAASMTGTEPDRARLHVGWVSGQQYVGVDEGTLPVHTLLVAAIGAGSRPAAPVTIAGQRVTARTDRHGDPAYLLDRGPVRVVVTGTVGAARLQQLAGELRPVGSAG